MLKGTIKIKAIPMKQGCRVNVKTKMYIRSKADKIHLLKVFLSALEINVDEAAKMLEEIKHHVLFDESRNHAHLKEITPHSNLKE